MGFNSGFKGLIVSWVNLDVCGPKETHLSTWIVLSIPQPAVWIITPDVNSVLRLELLCGSCDKLNLQNDPYNKNQQDALFSFNLFQ